MTRQRTAPKDARAWIERAAALLNRDPAATAARLSLLPAAFDRAAACVPRIAADGTEADRAELAGRLGRIRRAVDAWHRLAALPGVAPHLESTRPAIEAAERLIAAARPRTEGDAP